MGNSSQISAPELKTLCKVCMAPGFESPLEKAVVSALLEK